MFKDTSEQSNYLANLMLPEIERLRAEITAELRVLNDLEAMLVWGNVEVQLVSTLPLAWDHEELEQAQIEGRHRKVLDIENGIVTPGDPEYDEEVAECHVHQTARRLPTSSDTSSASSTG